LGSTSGRACEERRRTGTSPVSGHRESRGPTHRYEEAVITAIIAAVLFGIALLMHLAGFGIGPLDSTFFMLAGLVAAALHLAGIGSTRRSRVRH
jgi:hypothetical protein